MTETERAALSHIRQVVDSVIGVPAPPEPLPAGTYCIHSSSTLRLKNRKERMVHP